MAAFLSRILSVEPRVAALERRVQSVVVFQVVCRFTVSLCPWGRGEPLGVAGRAWTALARRTSPLAPKRGEKRCARPERFVRAHVGSHGGCVEGVYYPQAT
jgi:hypothetical protein